MYPGGRDEESHPSTLNCPSTGTTPPAPSTHQQSPSRDSVGSANNGSRWPQTWRAYFSWLGCFFLMFNSWGIVNSYGTFSSYYVGNSLRSVDQLQLNLIGSTQSFIVLLMSGPIGRLLDAGHFRAIIGTGAFFVPFGMFMLSVAHPSNPEADANFLTIWVTQGLVVGLGMGCFFVSSSQVAATWFPNHKALAVGVVACGASISGVVYPAMLRYTIISLGFNNAVRVVSTLVAITCIFSWVFAVPSPAHVHIKPQSWASVRVWLDTDAFKNKAFCWFTAAVAFLFFGFYPVFFNLEEWAAVSGFGVRDGMPVPVHVQNTSNKPLQTFWLLTIMNGASTFGRLSMSAFGDKTGALNMHIVAQIVSSLLVLVLWSLANSTAAAIAFCVFFGMFSGAVIGLPPASMGNILNCTYTTPGNQQLGHSKLGQWTGMMYTVAAIPSLVGPVVAGHLVSRYSDYITVQAWSGANLLISAFCMLATRWYLPLYDGTYVSDKLPWASKTRSSSEKQPDVAEIFADFSDSMSRSTTRVNSNAVSRKPSKENLAAFGLSNTESARN